MIVECFQAFFFFCSCTEMIGLLFYLFKFFLITLLIYIWLCRDSVATLAFTGCSEWGLRSSCVVQASHSSGFPCFRTQAPGHAGLSSWGTRAQQLHPLGSGAQAQYWGARALLLPCICHSPGSEIELVSPALVDGIFTTEPPGKPRFSPWTHSYFNMFIDLIF